MNRLVSAMLVGVFLIFQGCLMANELVHDIQQEREKNRSPRLDVSLIVGKHLQNGSSWSMVSERLVQEGFQYLAGSILKPEAGVMVYDFALDLRSWYCFGFGDKLMLYITVRDGKLTGSSGELFYQSL